MNMQPMISDTDSQSEHSTCLMDRGMRVFTGRESTMLTQGELEAAVCDGWRRFELEYVGRGPREANAHLLGNRILICMNGVLTEAEKRLSASTDPRGNELVRQVRTHLIALARPLLEAMIQGVTGVKLCGLHYDIDTTTEQEAILLTLENPPAVREVRRR